MARQQPSGQQQLVVVVSTSARLLRPLSLLSTRRSWTCADLAARLEITERTVRRAIARLREPGYGIESEVGPWGGYHLGPGISIPPLILDDEEALAVAVGLRTAALSGVSGSDQAALSALLKLRQVPAGQLHRGRRHVLPGARPGWLASRIRRR